MKKKLTFKKVFLSFIMSYLIIFTARAIYDLATFEERDIVNNYNVYYEGEKGESSLRNYASEKMEFTAGAGTSVMDQKYERIASITSKTVNYDADQAQFTGIVEENQAVVQMENRRGLSGSRRVDYVIGVRPENFDRMQQAVLQIGRITSSTTTKTDKTYEYRQMVAEKETLERRRASYEELKTNGGSISEMLQLEDKIIEVEALIQQQMISLGEYSDDNALCTINFSLSEGNEAGVARKLWNAFKWSTTAYVALLVILTLTAGCVMVVIAAWNGFKKVWLERDEEPKLQSQSQPQPQSQPQSQPVEKQRED